MALRMAIARSAISVGATLGLATVSIRAAVSPKLLLNWMGPAPRGNCAFSWFSLRLMSLNSFCLSFTLSSSWTYTTASPGKLIERMPKLDGLGGRMVVFCATACSIGRVTSCSTCSAVAPGHWHWAEATRTGMSGSLRLGMLWYPYQPQTKVAINKMSATCRCSVKNRAVLCVVAMISASDL